MDLCVKLLGVVFAREEVLYSTVGYDNVHSEHPGLHWWFHTNKTSSIGASLCFLANRLAPICATLIYICALLLHFKWAKKF